MINAPKTEGKVEETLDVFMLDSILFELVIEVMIIS